MISCTFCSFLFPSWGMFFQDGLTGSAWGDWANYTDSPLRAFEGELGVQAPVPWRQMWIDVGAPWFVSCKCQLHPWSLTVRPWKGTIPKGKHSSKTSCIRGYVRLQDCKQSPFQHNPRWAFGTRWVSLLMVTLTPSSVAAQWSWNMGLLITIRCCFTLMCCDASIRLLLGLRTNITLRLSR